MIQIYTQAPLAAAWMARYRGKRPVYACVLGFTETGLIPGISAAGATPESRRFTAIADAEFLTDGTDVAAQYPLPPLQQGASPVFIARAVLQGQDIPFWILDAGVPVAPVVPSVNLGGDFARCLSTGAAQEGATVKYLFEEGLRWGETLAAQVQDGYLILAECVVGGTTTALAVLAGLGFNARGKVNSSHPVCNHDQKWQLVQQGLAALPLNPDPWQVLAAVGDPMQAAAVGLMLAASRRAGVLLAGGTQMLAVYALARAIALQERVPWVAEQVAVGTTRWVAEDPTGDTVGLAEEIGQVPLLATQLSFASSRYPQLRAYEQGFVKEGVGAGGCAIAAHLYRGWEQPQLLSAIERLLDAFQKRSF
ncbi:nicotinate mononucleotide-dependent phosphoribosyltransferase CobT [Altericista sp. CCNU0014]|uniref:nicotinate mononucleotide-dependent phosphoribosyltransferase CobT n=1 Tax=Altericista sp. CCNU0014 TaxID=3082949 RepID=UPI00384C0E30